MHGQENPEHITLPASSAPGPQIGVPPSMEQVPLDRLQVDERYQRSIEGISSQRLIARMVALWDWRLFQPLVVSRREDGSLWVIDGQHRIAGARRRGDLPYLPCTIIAGMAVAEEAGVFTELQERRQKLSQADIFAAAIVAGDEHALAAQALLAETGWRQVRLSNTALWKPGDLFCAPRIARWIKQHGPAPVADVLTVLRRAWPDQAITSTATLLQALIELRRPGGALAGESADALVQALAARMPGYWPNRGMVLREHDPSLSRCRGIALAIGRAVKPEAFAPPARAAPPVPVQRAAMLKPDKFGPEGWGWCDQREQRVTRDRAAACASAFCAMRAGQPSARQAA